MSQSERNAVMRRHQFAMQLVTGLKDQEDRMALLAYVLVGSEAIDEAFDARRLRMRRRPPVKQAA